MPRKVVELGLIKVFKFQAKNPAADLRSSINPWLNYSLDSAYYPNTKFFWGRKFTLGNIDIGDMLFTIHNCYRYFFLELIILTTKLQMLNNLVVLAECVVSSNGVVC